MRIISQSSKRPINSTDVFLIFAVFSSKCFTLCATLFTFLLYFGQLLVRNSLVILFTLSVHCCYWLFLGAT